MAGKEYREVRKRLGNEPADSSPYVLYARALLGELKNEMRLGGLKQGIRRRRIENVLIEAMSIFGQDEIRITPIRILVEKKRGLKDVIKYRYNVILGSFYVSAADVRQHTFIKFGNAPAREIAPVSIESDGNIYPGGLSKNGLVAAITVNRTAGVQSAARWTDSSYDETGSVDSNNISVATGISALGNKICGYEYFNFGAVMHGFVWTKDAGIKRLPSLPGHTKSEAHGISADGRIVVGRSGSDTYDMYACYWDVSDMDNIGGPTSLGMLGIAYAASEYGTVIVGKAGGALEFSAGEGFVWTEADGVTELGIPVGNTICEMRAISYDGRVIAGNALDGDDGSKNVVKWTGADGFVALQGGNYPKIFLSQGMSHDGLVVVGSSYVGPAPRACIWNGDEFSYIDDDLLGYVSNANCVATAEGEQEIIIETEE